MAEEVYLKNYNPFISIGKSGTYPSGLLLSV